MKKFLTAVLTTLALAVCAEAPQKAPTQEAAALVKSLQAGGYVIVFRHGAPNRDMADTDPLNLDNVAKQRQVGVRGRQVARDVGAALKTLHFPIGQVFTSRFY